MKTIQRVILRYKGATGEELSVQRTVGQPAEFGYPKVQSLRIRWAGGAGGTFRLYQMREDGILSTLHIPQHNVIAVETTYQKDAK